MGTEIDSLKTEDATASGRKIVQLIQALQEVQGKRGIKSYLQLKYIFHSSGVHSVAFDPFLNDLWSL
jgi:hypothetical protein